MSDVIELQELTPDLVKPYVVTRSKLGSTTKVIDEKFICGVNEIETLFNTVGEKISSFNPSKAGFQYLASFTDSTHYENNSLSSLSENVKNTEKKTEKLILNWVIGHEYDGIENEISITVRISNPMNPFVMLQAAMSKDHSEADNLDFEDGSLSVSINGATQTTAEEIFALVNRWAKACPQPQSITGINNTIYKHTDKISFINQWVFPALFLACAFFILKEMSYESSQPYALLAFAGFIFVRAIMQNTNNLIKRWAHFSRKFSLFMITGGDNNQQTKIAAKSKTNTIKLVFSVGLSFVLNVAAGLAVAWYIGS